MRSSRKRLRGATNNLRAASRDMRIRRASREAGTGELVGSTGENESSTGEVLAAIPFARLASNCNGCGMTIDLESWDKYRVRPESRVRVGSHGRRQHGLLPGQEKRPEGTESLPQADG